jgi:hypothetical protein
MKSELFRCLVWPPIESGFKLVPIMISSYANARHENFSSIWRRLARRAYDATNDASRDGPRPAHVSAFLPTPFHGVVVFHTPYNTMFLRASILNTPFKRIRSRLFSSLKPSELAPSDWLDLAGKKKARVWWDPPKALLPGVQCDISYRAPNDGSAPRGSRGWTPPSFPAHAQGFLYYTAPPSFPAAGQVRFRLAPFPDPSLFHKGEDLLLPTGLPWSLPAPALRAAGLLAIRTCLFSSGDLSPAHFDRWQNLPISSNSQILREPSGLFFVDFASVGTIRFWVADGADVHPVALQNLTSVRDGERKIAPYTGASFSLILDTSLNAYDDIC